MKKMLPTLAMLPWLALAAAAQEASWKDLAPGDPVRVTLQNGATISGTLVAPRAQTLPGDFAALSTVTLDLALEAPGVSGTVTFEKRDLRECRRLRITVEPRNLPSAGSVPPPASRTEGPKPAAADAADPSAEPAPPQTDKEAEELKKAVDFYNKFPPPDWGPIRHTLNIQKMARGQTLTPLEREFEDGYPALWEKGRDASQKK